jgi:hypothetical protein
MVTLEPVLRALGYQTEGEQRNFIKLLAASGAFGQLPGVTGTLTDMQARAIATRVTFNDNTEAANWLHDATQKHMLHRQPGVERFECEEPEFFKQNRSELLGALHHLGILDEKRPQAKHYDHVLVLGSMEGIVSTRMDMIKEMYDQGVRFDKIHLLGSDRHLEPSHEPFAKIASDVGGVATEMQMMTARAYEKSESWPEALQNVRMFSVDTFNHSNGTRANTQDNTRSWLHWMTKTNMPLTGRVLVISSQPNVAYQDAAVKSVLPPGFTVETVGARVSESNLKISVAMDDIARQIDVGFPKLLEALQKPQQQQQAAQEMPKLVMLDPAEIKVDAPTYQFRSGGDKNGVTQKRRGNTSRWDPILDGDPLLVHNGTVVDGHHRRDRAAALNAQGKGPGKIAAIVLGDNYTKQTAKIVGAYKNMAHELRRNGSDARDIADGARAFKEAETLPFDQKKLLPHLRLDGDLKISYTLHKMTDASLDMVANGNVPVVAAVEVTKQVADPVRQESVMRLISAKLQQNYESFAAQHHHYETRTQVQSSAVSVSQQFSSKPGGNIAPGFLAKLQQQRAEASASTEIRLG